MLRDENSIMAFIYMPIINQDNDGNKYYDCNLQLKMLVPTSPYFFDRIKNDPKDKINTIRIDYSKLAFLPIRPGSYTSCEKCSAILTSYDKNTIPFTKQKQNITSWKCRFCQSKNQAKGQIYFQKNNMKIVLQKNITLKITPPIIIFLMDYSGSMNKAIFQLKYSSTKVSSRKTNNIEVKSQELQKIIRGSKLYQAEAQKRKQLQQLQVLQNRQDFQSISRIQLFYAIIEECLKSIKQHKKVPENYRICFLFFNRHIYLMKACYQKQIPVFINNSPQADNDHLDKLPYPLEPKEINFNKFKDLFKEGTKYEQYFGDSRINNMNTSKMNIDAIEQQAGTALGPALALALGIASSHNTGSRIICVTDSQPNYGLLALSQQQNQKAYKKAHQIIQKQRIALSILKLRQFFQQIPKEQKKLQKQFKEFMNSSLIQKIQLQIENKVISTLDRVQQIKQYFKNMIMKTTIGQSQKINLFNDSPLIKLSKLDQDRIDYRVLRFLDTTSKNYIQMSKKIGKNNIYDTLLPFMTQLVMEYDDVFRGQRILFMSYTLHKIVKQETHKQLSDVQHLNQTNPFNIQDIYDLNNICEYEKAPSDRTFNASIYLEPNREVLKIRDVQLDISVCDSINSLSKIKNRLNYHDEYSQEQEIIEEIYL